MNNQISLADYFYAQAANIDYIEYLDPYNLEDEMANLDLNPLQVTPEDDDDSMSSNQTAEQADSIDYFDNNDYNDNNECQISMSQQIRNIHLEAGEGQCTTCSNCQNFIHYYCKCGAGKRKFLVFGHDHVGHGKSDGKRCVIYIFK